MESVNSDGYCVNLLRLDLFPHSLPYVSEVLRGLLVSQDLLTDVLQRSRELCLRIYKKPKFNPLEYLSKPHAVVRESLNKRQLYALKYLCMLRDTIAQ
ncbi:hypothetical protein TSMEX_002982 [Taenia solium]|eukprot:TsM_000303100 transcript=TsM_000303100 gene=TsM_000303100